MDDVKKKVLILDGLGCANCAVKIEKEVGGINGVDNAAVDFINKKLTITYNSLQSEEKILQEASKIAESIENGIKVKRNEEVSDPKDNSEFYANKIRLLRLFSGGLLFAAAIIFEFSHWLELTLFLSSYVIFGGDILLHALKNIVKGRVFDENFLMSLATLGAFAIGEYPEGVSVMLFFQIGETFQEMAVNRSRGSIKALLDIRPDYANLKIDGHVKKVSPEMINIGQLIEIKPGEKIPLDGEVIEGVSTVDTSALTGESLPRDINPGSEVLGGFINIRGLLTVRVSKTFEETAVSKIIEMVQNSGSRKAKTESFITKFAGYYTPAVVIAAAATAFIPPMLIEGATFSEWIYRALIFLVISCPCALVVSIPLSYFGGIGGASRNGILIKGGNYLEALNNVDTVVFDKTGTLTKGVFKVTNVKPQPDITEDELLEYAAIAESHSNHPIAESIRKAFKGQLDSSRVGAYDELSGLGIKVFVEGKEILAGNSKLMEMGNISYQAVEESGTIVYISVGGSFAGHIVISDEVKPDSKETIKGLKKLGIGKVVMLTGDNHRMGSKVAGELGIDEFHADLLPQHKVEKLELLEKGRTSNKKMAFVGDGINDAPVIARADVGIAMGGLGSDAAIEAADIVIMSDEPSKLVDAINIAKKTRSIVWQNIIFALGVKVIVLILGAGGMATMWEAVFADVGVALIAVLNAMRVMKVKKVS